MSTGSDIKTNLLAATITFMATHYLLAGFVFGQYSVAPNAVVITAPSRSTEMYIRMSPDASPMEFNMSSYFAVPGTDSSGNFHLSESREQRARDASASIRFTPRRFILNAGEHQLVRITVTNDTLPDGEYWSRVVASAKMVPNVSISSTDAVSASIGLEIQTVTGFLYRKGDLRSDIMLNHASLVQKNDSLFLDLDLAKESNAAWLGTVKVAVEDSLGVEIHRTTMAANAYLGGKYRYHIPMSLARSGVYRAHITLHTQRDDPTLPLIQAPEIQRTIPFILKAG